ncbi:BZ3500_MvSof-1268-A1-R1_Chr1-3g02230 [Microbotryum saponariae]|uniref:Phospholipase n=1 Tax=Microbotryum saponariae TaxID=289078 RepID=A0A2X0KEE7_9BASI|nr:BZ3500_MvSof-1268-A1-R1_Chr1-3g02230 [Microbotryum saponariae]SCZ95715.1 BZ3501_MvSof-1269-A2-R1_Chr1-3g01833 [Microbotryum saponariae]
MGLRRALLRHVSALHPSLWPASARPFVPTDTTLFQLDKMSGFSSRFKDLKSSIDTSKFKDIASSVEKLTSSMEKMPGRLERLGESVRFAYNPNHRHDEEHEREEDRIRAEICAAHRFGSFAAVSNDNLVKWYIDGHDFCEFHDRVLRGRDADPNRFSLTRRFVEILEGAQDSIFIVDWWLSPELHLRRPPAENDDWRIDRLLRRKAQAGVRIFIIVYKEVTQSMALSSAHTMHYLMDLHENISVMRHPDHLGGEMSLIYSHHEKIIVVDAAIATIGGLDLCFGRYDTNAYPLADVHLTDFKRTLFAGQDYNNARIQDFAQVDHWLSNSVSRLDTARMPWHDCHSCLVGPAVLDVAQHFIERWNFIRDLKYSKNKRYAMLSFPHVIVEGQEPEPAIVRHPHMERFKRFGENIVRNPITPDAEATAALNMRVQVLRSSADWSHGILPESSIQTAYLQMIAEANNSIHIENQFFITSTTDKGPIKNLIGKALVERILSAARSGRKFKVTVIIPSIPGFAGDLNGNSGLLAIMHSQYSSICRGGNSIMELIAKEGFDPHEYIGFYALRVYDRLPDAERVKQMEQRSGVDFNTAQAALARIFMGREPPKDELRDNQELSFAPAEEGGEVKALDPREKKKPETGPPVDKRPLPQSYQEALETIQQFEQGDVVREELADSISHHVFQGTGSLLDEPWFGTEESERKAYVSELVYSHLKLMIVDDRRVIMGSANINERSMRGDRDSEIAIVIEDTDMIPSRMDGQPYMAARFAATLRRRLWRQHLGLAEPTLFPKDSAATPETVTAAMLPPDVPHDDETESTEDALVADPLSGETIALWQGTAKRNAEIFEEVFHCVPSDRVHTWNEYKAFVPQAPVKPGHVADPNMSAHEIKTKLDQVRGHLVPLPLEFLDQEKLLAMDAAVNPMTLDIYV